MRFVALLIGVLLLGLGLVMVLYQPQWIFIPPYNSYNPSANAWYQKPDGVHAIHTIGWGLTAVGGFLSLLATIRIIKKLFE